MSHTTAIYPGVVPPPHHPIAVPIGFPTVARARPLCWAGAQGIPLECAVGVRPAAMPGESPHLPR